MNDCSAWNFAKTNFARFPKRVAGDSQYEFQTIRKTSFKIFQNEFQTIPTGIGTHRTLSIDCVVLFGFRAELKNLAPWTFLLIMKVCEISTFEGFELN